MKSKIDYESAEIRVIDFAVSDIITISDGSMGTSGGNSTESGWTPLEW